MKPASGIMRSAFQRSATTRVTLLVPAARAGRLQATARGVFAPACSFKGVWIRRRADLTHGSGGERQGYTDLIQFVVPTDPGFVMPLQGHRIVRGLYAVDDTWSAADEWEIASPPDHLSEYDAFHVIQLQLRKFARGGAGNG
jgi:hypothetical protein